MESIFRRGRAVAPILAALAVCILFISAATVPFGLKGKARAGQPYSFTEDKEYLTPISDYASDGQFLYVLFEERGIVKVYSQEGTYLKTHYFLQSKNGTARLIPTEDGVFLEARGYDLYSFRGAEVDSFFPFSENGEMRNTLSNMEGQKPVDDPLIRKGTVSLYRVSGSGGETLLVPRPFWLFFFDPKKAICLMLFSLLLFAVCEKGMAHRKS